MFNWFINIFSKKENEVKKEAAHVNYTMVKVAKRPKQDKKANEEILDTLFTKVYDKRAEILDELKNKGPIVTDATPTAGLSREEKLGLDAIRFSGITYSDLALGIISQFSKNENKLAFNDPFYRELASLYANKKDESFFDEVDLMLISIGSYLLDGFDITKMKDSLRSIYASIYDNAGTLDGMFKEVSKNIVGAENLTVSQIREIYEGKTNEGYVNRGLARDIKNFINNEMIEKYGDEIKNKVINDAVSIVQKNAAGKQALRNIVKEAVNAVNNTKNDESADYSGTEDQEEDKKDSNEIPGDTDVDIPQSKEETQKKINKLSDILKYVHSDGELSAKDATLLNYMLENSTPSTEKSNADISKIPNALRKKLKLPTAEDIKASSTNVGDTTKVINPLDGNQVTLKDLAALQKASKAMLMLMDDRSFSKKETKDKDAVSLRTFVTNVEKGIEQLKANRTEENKEEIDKKINSLQNSPVYKFTKNMIQANPYLTYLIKSDEKGTNSLSTNTLKGYEASKKELIQQAKDKYEKINEAYEDAKAKSNKLTEEKYKELIEKYRADDVTELKEVGAPEEVIDTVMSYYKALNNDVTGTGAEGYDKLSDKEKQKKLYNLSADNLYAQYSNGVIDSFVYLLKNIPAKRSEFIEYVKNSDMPLMYKKKFITLSDNADEAYTLFESNDTKRYMLDIATNITKDVNSLIEDKYQKDTGKYFISEKESKEDFRDYSSYVVSFLTDEMKDDEASLQVLIEKLKASLEKINNAKDKLKDKLISEQALLDKENDTEKINTHVDNIKRINEYISVLDDKANDISKKISLYSYQANEEAKKKHKVVDEQNDRAGITAEDVKTLFPDTKAVYINNKWYEVLVHSAKDIEILDEIKNTDNLVVDPIVYKKDGKYYIKPKIQNKYYELNKDTLTDIQPTSISGLDDAHKIGDYASWMNNELEENERKIDEMDNEVKNSNKEKNNESYKKQLTDKSFAINTRIEQIEELIEDKKNSGKENSAQEIENLEKEKEKLTHDQQEIKNKFDQLENKASVVSENSGFVCTAFVTQKKFFIKSEPFIKIAVPIEEQNRTDYNPSEEQKANSLIENPYEDTLVDRPTDSLKEDKEKDQTFSTKKLSNLLKIIYKNSPDEFNNLVDVIRQSNPQIGDELAEFVSLLPQTNWTPEEALRKYNETAVNTRNRNYFWSGLKESAWPELIKNKEVVEVMKDVNDGNSAMEK